MNPEQQRLADSDAGTVAWKRWGPYLADRAWGTVREDYSADGDAWNYFPHDHARSRAYRWNEDGIGGLCDDKQHICLALAFWNEKDPILKERMFGLTNLQGNHGEDVKEYYFFLDATPTHSYLRMLYKYPQVAYPYDDLIAENGRRDQSQPEYELIDALSDAFQANRYFDVTIEYAKAGPDDILCRITAENRGPDAAPLHILPHLWFRNTWSWKKQATRHVITTAAATQQNTVSATTSHPKHGARYWYVRSAESLPVNLMFTENDTNYQRLDGVANATPYVKDGINDAVVSGRRQAVNPRQGSKAAARVRAAVPAGGQAIVEVRFSDTPLAEPFADFDAVFTQRAAEADAFYAGTLPARLSEDERRVARQACAGLIWSKQYYHYDVYRWLKGDEAQPPPPPERWHGRNAHWKELHNADVILMPDTWEYPWYAAWDLAFHCIAMARIDLAAAKNQLLRMGYEWYQHASGQFPAYEWNFDDVNPPVSAWAAWRIYQIERDRTGQGDLDFLKSAFLNEMLSFSFWVNRKDRKGRDLFGGGFLGMDNITGFDRDLKLPDGAVLAQSDGTSWMATFCISMLSISTELARHEPIYQNLSIKYFEHFLFIAHAMTNMDGAGIELWDPEDQFFYDVELHPSGQGTPFKCRSMVGLVPFFAVLSLATTRTANLQFFVDHAHWFMENRPDLLENVAPFNVPGDNGTRLLAIFSEDRLVAALRRMLDPEEFLSDYGIRALSRYHLDHPYIVEQGGERIVVKYLPAESDSRLFGGNSNWLGPIWFPVNYMLVRALHEFDRHYGQSLQVEFPTGSGQQHSLGEVAAQIARRLANIFLRDPKTGRRAVWGDNEYFQTDPHWRDLIPFHEYFNGDTGAGVGASHQTGWTALIISLLFEYGGADGQASK